jgi:two-component system cell cycle sensor histidine kinase/response regulator CckA
LEDSLSSTKGIIVHLIDATEIKNLEMRFAQSQKMQAVGQLAGGIAHDFNNLLTAMMGFCDLLLMRHPAGDQSFADIMQIKQNANRAANLVKQLLAFSRKQTLQPKIINITDVLADLSNLIGRLIGENIELKMIHGRDLGCVRVDPVQLEQVIINLAVNARDAMSDGGDLTVRTSNINIKSSDDLAKTMMAPAADEEIEPGDYVLVEVIDTGCGIEKEKVGAIFEPFFSTKEIGSGTGLGLATVYGIIKQTDGYIYVSSKIDKGTKFSVFLKRYNKEVKDDKKLIEDKKEQKGSATVDLTGQGTILLVEDEAPVRIFSNSALVSKGYTVLEAENATKALEIVKDHGKEIDVIISDVVMPGMSGPDMVKEITKKHKDVKIIFISGYGEDAFIESFGDERKFNFLSKPYSLKQLATKVKDVLETEYN